MCTSCEQWDHHRKVPTSTTECSLMVCPSPTLHIDIPGSVFIPRLRAAQHSMPSQDLVAPQSPRSTESVGPWLSPCTRPTGR